MKFNEFIFFTFDFKIKLYTIWSILKASGAIMDLNELMIELLISYSLLMLPVLVLSKRYNNKCQKLMRTGPACETYTLALSSVNLQSTFRKTGIYSVDRNVISSFSVFPAEVFQSSVNNEGDNINGVNSDVAIHIDESGDSCLNTSTCTSSGGHDNINLSQQSDTLAKSPSSFLNDKLNKICAVKCGSSNKLVRNCSSKITSGQAITGSPVQQKLVNHL